MGYLLALRPGEAERLRTTRQLRNKVLHCTFDIARDKLAELGTQLPGAAVWRGELGDKPAPIMRVTNRSTAEVGVYGWLLASGAIGLFPAAHRAFIESIAIIDRVLVALSTPDP